MGRQGGTVAAHEAARARSLWSLFTAGCVLAGCAVDGSGLPALDEATASPDVPVPAASPAPDAPTESPRRIVSLDYCADQYVLGLADRDRILALSPDAREAFSYLRHEAEGLSTVRQRIEDVLALHPDLVVRSYGGGPRATLFLQQAGVPVLALGFMQDIDAVRATVRRAAATFGVPERGESLVTEMDAGLERAKRRAQSVDADILYLSPAGVSAGPGTFVHELIETAGFDNFQRQPGWRSLPLERLAYETPERYAVGLFGRNRSHVDAWTPFRHPVATRRVAEGPMTPIDGATVTCGGWYLVDAVEALVESAG
ncbi:MAG: ABC transporter substrate-binding protein [Acidobacteria bacterium]|nr:ABC transporter substrate-binding protein [Acidobacteriota bacterium]MYJ03704.1 ABC transporter substrate-binding protein [Acidobacteriota bacterium]